MHEQQTISREDPMFDHVESIDFSATFWVTAEFAFGHRKACEHATAHRGATVQPRPLEPGVVGFVWLNERLAAAAKIDGAVLYTFGNPLPLQNLHVVSSFQNAPCQTDRGHGARL